MNLDDLEQHLIQAARRDLGPALADRERHQLMLSAQLREAGAGDPAGSPASADPGARQSRALAPSGVAPAGASVSRGLRVKLLGAGMVVGAVIGGWVGFGLGRSLPAPTVELSRPPELLASASSRAPAAAPVQRPPSAADEALPARPPASSAEGESNASDALDSPMADVTRAVAAPRRAKLSATAAPVIEESSLAVELAMLQRARRALNAGNGRLALGIVQELDERFPKGVLIEERRATRVLSLCMLERTEEARRFAAEFEQRHKGSVYAERVRESCVADALE
jgi:hypothetical protein